MSRTGFTLIELLVVIAIIAVLASLLMPVLSLAQNASLKASCMSQMWQIGMALDVYADDWDCFPPKVDARELDYTYRGFSRGLAFLAPDYIDQQPGRASVRMCPAFRNDASRSNRFGYCYYGNQRVAADASGTNTYSPWNAEKAASSAPYAVSPGRIVCTQPAGGSSVVMLTDVITEYAGSDLSYLWHPHPKDYAQRAAGIIPLVSGGNVLFLDGHVAWLPGQYWRGANTGIATFYWPQFPDPARR